MKVKRLGAAAGAEITGVDISKPLSNAEFDALHQAFMDHCVVAIRGQDLSPEAQLAFTQRFGKPTGHVLEGFALPGYPNVLLISNKKKKEANGQEKPVGAIYAGQYWHTDISYMAEPAMASMLHAKEMPSVGGDTMFANMYMAYDTLSEPMKAFLGSLDAVHDYTLAYENVFSKMPGRPPMSEETRKMVPPVVHPVIRTHPVTKKKALYVNQGFTRRIQGLSEDESRALLDFLFMHSTRPEFVYRHKWSVGDVVMWDNRCMMHRAIADYDMNEPRHLHRTTIAGDKPFN